MATSTKLIPPTQKSVASYTKVDLYDQNKVKAGTAKIAIINTTDAPGYPAAHTDSSFMVQLNVSSDFQSVPIYISDSVTPMNVLSNKILIAAKITCHDGLQLLGSRGTGSMSGYTRLLPSGGSFGNYESFVLS